MAKDLVFHAPCVVNDKVGTAQLRQRLEMGFAPSIIYRGNLSEKTIDELRGTIRETNKSISFDFGEAKEDQKYSDMLAFISHLCSDFPNVERAVGIKPGSAVGYSAFTGRGIPFSIGEYKQAFAKHSEFLRRLAEEADNLDLSFELENRPEPNYAFFPDGNHGSVPIDTAPRWGGKWSPFVQFIGTFGASYKNIQKIISSMDGGASLHLDLEHLAQTCQWGSVFNFGRMHTGILRIGDLTVDERQAMVSCGIEGEDEEVLVDYLNLTKDEESFLDDFGFVFRTGQPPVYGRRLTLCGELDNLRSNVPVDGITPGFQVYQGLIDEGRYVIGSHMPGITEQYIKDPELRRRLTGEIREIHQAGKLFMEKEGITDVEIEFQIDDGQRTVYDGPEWEAQTREGLRQLKDNLKDKPSEKPFYLV
nr:hypothetical protein [uncultured archaeon]AQS29483.1 hypothetical protein [uncultured archaeon]